MMKSLLLGVAAFAVIQSINCYVYPDENAVWANQFNFQTLEDRIHTQASSEKLRSKIETVCPGYGSKIENVTLEVRKCLIQIDEEQQTFCSVIQQDVPRCIAPMENTLEECLPSQSKNLPSMIRKMYLSIIKHLCKSDGEHIFELRNHCFFNVNVKTERCLRRVLTKTQDFARRNKYPTSGEVCEILEGLGPCLQSHLNYACGHHITKETFLGIYDEVISVCKSYEENEIDVVNPTVQ